MNKRLAPICFASVDSESEAPFTRYIGLSNRFDNRMYRVYKHSTGCQNLFDNRIDNRLDVRLHDTAGCETGCTTGCTTGLTTGCIV